MRKLIATLVPPQVSDRTRSAFRPVGCLISLGLMFATVSDRFAPATAQAAPQFEADPKIDEADKAVAPPPAVPELPRRGLPSFPKLKTGNPSVTSPGAAKRPAAAANAAGAELHLSARIDGKDQLLIYQDRAEWKHQSGAPPTAVKLNGVDWPDPSKRPLANSGATQFLPADFRFFGFNSSLIAGRGSAVTTAVQDHLVVSFDDTAEGASDYELILRPGLELPDFKPPPTAVRLVTEEWRKARRSPLPVKSMSLKKDVDAQWLAWRRGRLTLAYEKFGRRDAKWDEYATAMLESEAAEAAFTLPQLVEYGRGIIEIGCDDPLICFLHAEHLFRSGNAAGAERFALHAVLAFDESKYPKRASRLAPALLARIYQSVNTSPERTRLSYELLQRSFDETADVACERLSPEELRPFFHEVRHDFDRKPAPLFRPGGRQVLVATLLKRTGVDRWLESLFLGDYLYVQAYDARGIGYADTVTPAAHQGFVEHIGQARARYLEAWRLHPDFPEAAERLISTTMAGGGVAGESTRFWFDQAVKAQFDSQTAYSRLMIDLLPRWHGSHEEILRFGIECAQTKRFDTSVPAELWIAIAHIKEDGGNPRAVVEKMQRLDVIEEVLAGYEASLAGDPKALIRRKSRNIALALKEGWREAAKKRLIELGDDIDREALVSTRMTLEDLRNDLLHGIPFVPLPELRAGPRDSYIPQPPAHAALAPDGKTLAYATSDRGADLKWTHLPQLAAFYDLANDRRCVVDQLQYSWSGSYLAALLRMPPEPGEKARPTVRSTVALWKAKESKPRLLFPLEKSSYEAFCWMRDDRFLALALGSVAICDRESGKQKAIALSQGRATAIDASPDGTLMAVGNRNGEVLLWEVPSAETLAKAEQPIRLTNLMTTRQHSAPILDIAFSPDGKRFFTSDRLSADGALWVWNTETRAPIAKIDAQRGAFSADGKQLVTTGGAGADARMLVWNAETLKPAARFPGTDLARFTDAFFSADGRKIFAVDPAGWIRTWEFPKK